MAESIVGWDLWQSKWLISIWQRSMTGMINRVVINISLCTDFFGLTFEILSSSHLSVMFNNHILALMTQYLILK